MVAAFGERDRARTVGIIEAQVGHVCIATFPTVDCYLLVDVSTAALVDSGVTPQRDEVFAADVNFDAISAGDILPDSFGPLVISE